MSNPKESARGRANYLQRIGAVKKPQACSECGRIGEVEKHHYDYGKPGSVIWLCRRCHAAKRRKHVINGLVVCLVFVVICAVVMGCSYWHEWQAEAAAAGTTPEDQIVEVVTSGSAFLPSPWREIIIAVAGLAGIVLQTISKRRLQKKLHP